MTHARLSARQREVLKARCETGSRKAAADRLGVSVWTVHRTLLRAFERCGCEDEAQACWAHRGELEGVTA